MENLFWIGFAGAALAGIYALLQARKVMKFPEGTDKMKQIAGAIREGANAYLKRQYKTILPVFAIVFVILAVMAFVSKGQLLSQFKSRKPYQFQHFLGSIRTLFFGLIH